MAKLFITPNIDIAPRDSTDVYIVNKIDPEFLAYVRTTINGINAQYSYCIGTQKDALRSVEQQNGIPKENTNATGGKSPHNYGYAVDVYPCNPITRERSFQISDTTNAKNNVTLVVGQLDRKLPLRSESVLPEWWVLINAVRQNNNLTSGADFYVGVKYVNGKPTGGTPDYGHIELKNWRDKARNINGAAPYLGKATVVPAQFSNINMSAFASALVSPALSMNHITPYIASLESFHPKIQYELTRRRLSTETINTHIPFVKLTSLLAVHNKNLTGKNQSAAEFKNLSLDDNFGAYFPSIGLHGRETQFNMEDILSSSGDGASIVGYAQTEDGQTTKKLFVEDTTQDQLNIPLPGITGMTIERSTAGPMGVRGGLTKADIKIRAYSIGQLDTLIRYVLRPSTRVVLEFGMESSNPAVSIPHPFDWNRGKDEIITDITNIIQPTDKNTQHNFIKEHIYENYGRYEIFVGYVVKFNLKYTKNNTYEIDLTVHSVQQFEVPNASSGVLSTCKTSVSPCKVNDIF
jgi:hypothetical protein